MITTATLLSFLAAALLLTIMPGPDIMLVLAESISKGKEQGLALSAGLCSGVLVHTLAAATGLSLFIQTSAWAFQFLKYAGAAYLFYLAVLALREKRPAMSTTSNSEAVDFFKMARKGFLMNVLNPKVSLFFIAFLPQFVEAQNGNITLQMCFLGVLFMLQAFTVFGLVSILSGKLSKYANSDKFWSTTKYAKAGILGILALGLAFTHKQ